MKYIRQSRGTMHYYFGYVLTLKLSRLWTFEIIKILIRVYQTPNVKVLIYR